MNVLKKIASYLFEEEEVEDEVIAEDELEPVVFAQEAKKSEPQEQVELSMRMEENKEAAKPVESMPAAHHLGSITADAPKAKSSVKRKPLERNPKQEYEVAPVISPMYGTGKVQGGISQSKGKSPKKQNPLGTIISPMYGAKELEAMSDAAQSELAVKEKEAERAEIVEETLVDIPLDQMLVKDVPVESDDVLQFSLFGEDEIVKHAFSAYDPDDEERKKA